LVKTDKMHFFNDAGACLFLIDHFFLAKLIINVTSQLFILMVLYIRSVPCRGMQVNAGDYSFTDFLRSPF